MTTMYLNILYIGRYSIIYNSTLSTRYKYLLPLSLIQIIISKLPTIIYKSRIIYKANNSPYKQGLAPLLIYYKYRFHQTPLHVIIHNLLSHTHHMATSMCPSFSLSLIRGIYNINCFTLLTHILT